MSELPAATRGLLAVGAIAGAGVLLLLAGAVAIATGWCWLDELDPYPGGRR